MLVCTRTYAVPRRADTLTLIVAAREFGYDDDDDDGDACQSRRARIDSREEATRRQSRAEPSSRIDSCDQEGIFIRGGGEEKRGKKIFVRRVCARHDTSNEGRCPFSLARAYQGDRQ